LDLQQETGAMIWAFAKENNFTIVSKDNDFHQRDKLHPGDLGA